MTVTSGYSDRIGEILRRQDGMEGDKRIWNPLYEDVAGLVDPRYVNQFNTNTPWLQSQGQDKTQRQYDSRPVYALNCFSSVMDWFLTPINQKYQRLKSTVPELNKIPRVARYLDEVRDILFFYRSLPKANFASQIGEHWRGLGSFGTSSLFIDRLDGGGIRYKSCHLGQTYFLNNHQGIVDTAHYKFMLTSRQAAQKFTQAPYKCPAKIIEEAKDSTKCDTQHTFIHCVYPNSDKDPTRADYKGMEYTSIYICVDLKEDCGESGYSTFPYAISRYMVAPNETYGRSGIMMVLPNVKSLNQMKRTVLKMGERAVDPVLLAADDGVVGTVSLRSGYVNYGSVDAQGRKLVHALDTNTSNMPIGKELMDDERAAIDNMLLMPVFKILEENPQMTATQVLEIVKAKNALVAPMMGRQQSETLGPMTERELDLLARQHLLPAIPPEFLEAGAGIHILYDSPMSRAMRAEEAGGFMRTLEMGIEYANATQDPSVFDHLDMDAAIPEIADINATPARWIATPEQVAAKRQGRAQQQRTQQLIDAAPAIAGIVKNAGTGAGTPGIGAA